MGVVRRTLVAAAACLLILPASAGAEVARSADGFVESVGVNVHLTYDDTAYGNFSMVRQRLRELGVRYVRDGACGGCDWQHDRLLVLAQDGIRSDLIIGTPRSSTGTLKANLDAVKRKLLPSVVSVEGPNEWDLSGSPTWSSDLRTYQSDLWSQVQADPALRHLGVIGPSLAFGSRDALGDISPWTNFGNMHSYSGGRPPESSVSQNLALAARNSGPQPVMATEAGFHNALTATWGQPPVPEAIAASYLPRLFLDDFRRGVARTFSYELVDEWPGQSATNPEASFGLVRSDYTPKPAFVSLRNLLLTLADPGPNLPAREVPVEVGTGSSNDIQHLVLRKRDGRVEVVLWRKASRWDADRRVALPVAPVVSELRFGVSLSRAELVHPSHAAARSDLGVQGDSLRVAVGADPIVVELTPAPAGAFGASVGGSGTSTAAPRCQMPVLPTGSPIVQTGTRAITHTKPRTAHHKARRRASRKRPHRSRYGRHAHYRDAATSAKRCARHHSGAARRRCRSAHGAHLPIC